MTSSSTSMLPHLYAQGAVHLETIKPPMEDEITLLEVPPDLVKTLQYLIHKYPPPPPGPAVKYERIKFFYIDKWYRITFKEYSDGTISMTSDLPKVSTATINKIENAPTPTPSTEPIFPGGQDMPMGEVAVFLVGIIMAIGGTLLFGIPALIGGIIGLFLFTTRKAVSYSPPRIYRGRKRGSRNKTRFTLKTRSPWGKHSPWGGGF